MPLETGSVSTSELVSVASQTNTVGESECVTRMFGWDRSALCARRRGWARLAPVQGYVPDTVDLSGVDDPPPGHNARGGRVVVDAAEGRSGGGIRQLDNAVADRQHRGESLPALGAVDTICASDLARAQVRNPPIQMTHPCATQTQRPEGTPPCGAHLTPSPLASPARPRAPGAWRGSQRRRPAARQPRRARAPAGTRRSAPPTPESSSISSRKSAGSCAATLRTSLGHSRPAPWRSDSFHLVS